MNKIAQLQHHSGMENIALLAIFHNIGIIKLCLVKTVQLGKIMMLLKKYVPNVKMERPLIFTSIHAIDLD